jgi:hypothetical protein
MRVGWFVLVSFLMGCSSQGVGPTTSHRILPEESVSPAVPFPAVEDDSELEAAKQEPVLSPCEAHPKEENSLPFLKGQIHVHTARSYDASTPVPEVITFYANRGYDFLSITDHNHVTIAEDHPSGILLIPGVELTYNAQSCDPPPHPGYLCAFHSGVIFLNPMRDATRGRHFNRPFRRQRLEAFQVQIARGMDLEGLLILNHPTFHYAVDEELMDQLMERGYDFVEFFNGGVIDRSKEGAQAEIAEAERLWDAMLSRGRHVLAVGGDDAHHFSDAATIRMTGKKPLLGDRAWLMVRAERTAQGIREAMVDGDYYVSTGVELAHLDISEAAIHIEVQEKEGVAHVIRFMGHGGQVLARVEGSKACYPVVGNEQYVRAVVESDQGTYAFTQAVMLQEKGLTQPQE